MAKSATQGDKGFNLKDTLKEEKAISTAAAAGLLNDSKKERSLPDPCGKSELGKINIALHNFMTTLKGIKSYGELYVMGSINALQNVTNLIRQTSTIIAAVMKTLVNRLRDFLVDKIHKAIQQVIDDLLPQVAKSIKNTVVQTVVDNIFCAFKDIVKNLLNLVVDFLKELVEKVINVPFCAAQQFTNALVNNVAAMVDEAVGPLLDQINDVLGGVGKIVGSVFQALDYILGFESFLCAAPNCPEITKFKASPWGGPSKAQADAFNEFLAPLSGASAEGLIGDATKFIDGIEIFKGGGTLGDSAGAAGQSLEGACKELTGPSRCGPPKVEIFGGGGAGAVGELVLDDIGRTIGVNLLNRGQGYTRPPFVSFVDSCEPSFLGGYSIITTDGHIDRIVIKNPVIVPADDGRDEFDPPPDGPDDLTTPTNTGTSVTPDAPPPGGPGGGGPDDDTGGPGGPPPGGGGPDDGTGGTGIPPSKYGRDYVVCLHGFEVLDTGIGYTVNDSITITPNIPNLVASVQMTEYGQIIAINIADPVCGIPGHIDFGIRSETGYGANIRPIYEFIRIEEFEEDPNDTGINVDTNSIINAELSSGDREGIITTLRGRKLLPDGELNRSDVIRLVDCIS